MADIPEALRGIIARIDASRLYTERQSADLLGITKPGLTRRRFRGTAPGFIRVGGFSIRYSGQAIIDFLIRGAANMPTRNQARIGGRFARLQESSAAPERPEDGTRPLPRGHAA